MRPLLQAGDRGSYALLGLVLACFALLAYAAATGSHTVSLTLVTLACATLVLGARFLLRWSTLLGILLLTILFIPIRRYEMPGNLPFELEPYRLLVAAICLLWIGSLLVDSRVRVRRSGFEGPIFLVLGAAVVSVVANIDRVHELGVESDVAKKLTFLLSFVIVFYLIVSVVRTIETIDLLLGILVAGGAVLGVLTMVEQRTGYNAFDHLQSVLPFLSREAVPYSLSHQNDRLQAFASAEHPIALGAFLAMLVPIGIYLVRRSGNRAWWLATALILLGVLATRSRTAIVMLVVIGLVLLWLRPQAVKRAWLLVPVLLVVVPLALPGTIGTLKDSFFPQGGLISQQEKGAGTRGSGRIADIAPSLEEYAKRPLVGEGFGTRVVEQPRQNAEILDDQWLSTLLETGIVGALAWTWLYVRYVRRLARRAQEDQSSAGWLFVALVASVSAFAVGMFTYDAFSFIQVTFLLFILLALGACALALDPKDARDRRAHGAA